MDENPKIILLFSGKRKSGKDFLSTKLSSILKEENCALLHISGPLKGLYAKAHNLNLEELMSDGPYKEKYRLDMINWSEGVRAKTPGYFCEAACLEAEKRSIWIVADIRRKTDIEWFRSVYGNKIKTVRIVAEIDTRTNRGFVFKEGVDDATSECDLDDIKDWDLVLNNNSEEEANEAIKKLLKLLEPY